LKLVNICQDILILYGAIKLFGMVDLKFDEFFWVEPTLWH